MNEWMGNLFYFCPNQVMILKRIQILKQQGLPCDKLIDFCWVKSDEKATVPVVEWTFQQVGSDL